MHSNHTQSKTIFIDIQKVPQCSLCACLALYVRQPEKKQENLRLSHSAETCSHKLRDGKALDDPPTVPTTEIFPLSARERTFLRPTAVNNVRV